MTTPLLVVFGAFAAAQLFASFAGTFVDPLGAALPDVRVTLSSAARQSKYEVRSNPRGQFEFVGLPPGDYVLDAELPGFVTVHMALTIGGDQPPRTVTMEIGHLSETVTVGDRPVVVDRSTPARVARAIPPCPPPPPAGTVPIGGNLRPPTKIRDVPAIYPERLRGTGATTVVVLDARIGADGLIKEVRVREPAQAEFAGALVAAVRQWEFDSTLLNCVPVDVLMTVTGRFVHEP